MRQKHVRDLSSIDADAAYLGIPYDDATTFRPGARFGPRAIREASTLLKPYDPITGTDLSDMTIVDYDDVPVIPGYTEDTLDVIKDHISELLSNDTLPALAGGDHSTTLGALRGMSDYYGQVSLVQFDAHSDLWTEYFGKPYNHGTTVHHAIEEELIDPESSIRIGDRGGLYSPDDVTRINDSGIEYLTTEDAVSVDMNSLGEAIRNRANGPTYVTIDIDVVDPAFAPGTGTPMPGGLSSREILSMVRELEGMEIVGFDMVEVSPPYDNHGVTAILAANIMFRALCSVL